MRALFARQLGLEEAFPTDAEKEQLRRSLVSQRLLAKGVRHLTRHHDRINAFYALRRDKIHAAVDTWVNEEDRHLARQRVDLATITLSDSSGDYDVDVGEGLFPWDFWATIAFLATHRAFWWTTANEAQAMLFPVRPHMLPGVISVIREALILGFPALRLRACAHGLMLHGIDRALVSGFLAAIDQAVGGQRSVLKGPLHFPMTLSCHGALGTRGFLARVSSWKIGHAVCDNELLFVTDTGAFDEEALRYSVANAVMQPSAVTLVEALSPAGDCYRPAWLIRIPAAGTAAAAQWRANGLVLRVRGNRIAARAAPPIRALDTFANIHNVQDNHVASVQRNWVGRRTASIQEFFLRVSSASDDIFNSV